MRVLDFILFMEPNMAADRNNVVRNPKPLTKDRAKGLIATGLQRAVARHGMDEVALAAGSSRRCIEKALAHETLPSIETVANVLLIDGHVLDELLASYGYRIAPILADAANDFAIAASLSRTSGAVIDALADGQRCHQDTLRLAEKFRRLMPQMAAIISEADQIKGVAA